MYFDRFDIVQAYYTFYVNYHGGQASKDYARLCRIQKYFRPSPSFSGVDSLSDNGLMIYQNLIEKKEALKNA